MKKIHIANVDLNLLVVFDALVAEGHATRAAERIGLTQPAVSHSLNRLRALFGDPLFVRSPRGMTPTPLAQDIAPSVRSILEQVEGVLLGGRSFDPTESTRQFVVGLSDYAAFVLLPRLTARLGREAPGVSLVVRNTSRSVGLPMLDDGAVELIAGNFPQPPTHMREELLYEEDFICAGRGDHTDLADSLDLDRYLSLRHLQVSMKGNPSGYVDAVLTEKGLKRNVVVTVGHFLMAPMLVDASELVATEPRRLFAPLAGRLPLRLFRRHWIFLHFEWCRLGMRATTPTQGINGCDGCSVKSVKGFEGESPNPRCRPNCQDTDPPCTMPLTSRPSWRSMTGRHGTSVNSWDFSTMANLPLDSCAAR